MYDDIIQSLQKALATQKWIEGDQFHRIGQPFEWIDAGITPGHRQLSELASMLPHFTMIYEEYPTPQEIVTLDFDNVRNDIRSIMIDVFRSYFPFLNLDDYTRYFDATALTRAQDYGFIKSFSGLTERLRHLDIGPGLGSHAFYSLKAFDSLFFGLEAYPQTYQVQRNVFRILSNSSEHLYLDLIATESFGFQDREASEILSKHNQGIVHIPSWKFPIIDDDYFDLVTATWVYNEINFSGIMWLISNCVRTLKVGGYLYIRDSDQKKPGRHNVDYDDLLLQMGFDEVKRLRVKNRVDFYGVPRMYKKTKEVKSLSYPELVEQSLGHFDTTSNPLDTPSWSSNS